MSASLDVVTIGRCSVDLIEDRDVVLVTRGYHPVGAAHGYDLWYLNVMAGPVRTWRFHNEPAHAWLMKPPSPA